MAVRQTHFEKRSFLLIDKTNTFGISQGRLTKSKELQRFPSEAWQQEFFHASSIGFGYIELLTERILNKSNPVLSLKGRSEILHICSKTGCEIYTLCIDYIIENSLLNDPDKSTYQHILDIFLSAKELDCKAVIFPLLEKSELNSDNLNKYVALFKNLSNIAKKFNVEILIESLMPSDDLIVFFDLLNCQNIGAVFDTGNRVVDCDDLNAEILKLGSHIKHVHIKDKDFKGDNVILGTGLVNFKEVFEALNKIDYSGRLNFETTRGIDPINTALFHLNLCKFFIKEANNQEEVD